MPTDVAVVRIVIVAVLALAIEPKAQVTTPPANWHVPCVVVTETNCSADGMGALTVTPVAVAGPAFPTPIVSVTGLPAFGDAGVAPIVTETSAFVGFVTRVEPVEVLLVASGSFVVEETVVVSATMVPAAVAAFTCTTSGNVPVAFAARVAIVQVIVPVEPIVNVGVHAHPAGGTKLRKFEFGGTGSVTETLLAIPGPRFVTTEVNVTLLPALTLDTPAVVTICKSVSVAIPTTVVAVAELFAAFNSSVFEAIDTVSVILVPLGVPAFTFTTIVKLAVAEAANDVIEQLKVPPLGAEHNQPAAGTTLTKVVFAGIVSVSTGVAASLGPLFVTTCV